MTDATIQLGDRTDPHETNIYGRYEVEDVEGLDGEMFNEAYLRRAASLAHGLDGPVNLGTAEVERGDGSKEGVLAITDGDEAVLLAPVTEDGGDGA